MDSRCLLILLTLITLAIDPVRSLWCFTCHSAKAGCGDGVDLTLTHWVKCDDTLAENFCVKVVEHIGSSTYYTRGCISDILQSSLHRLQMPTVRRHGYCVNGRNYEMMKAQGAVLGTDYIKYCFCNDWNGCNGALSTISSSRLALLLPPAVILLLLRFF